MRWIDEGGALLISINNGYNKLFINGVPLVSVVNR